MMQGVSRLLTFCSHFKLCHFRRYIFDNDAIYATSEKFPLYEDKKNDIQDLIDKNIETKKLL